MDKLTNYEEFLRFMKIEDNIDIIESNIKEIIKIINSGNISGTPYNRKYLENFLGYLFKYIIEDLNLNNSRDFIGKFFGIILDLAFMYQEKFNILIKDFLNEKTDFILDDFSIETEIDTISENNNSKNFLVQFIKSGILFSYLTYNLGQTNQLISNFILLCNSILNNFKINSNEEENFIRKLKLKFIFISLILIISENINCFNPDILNCFKSILNLFESSFINKEDYFVVEELKNDLIFGNKLDLFNFESSSEYNNNKNLSMFIFLNKILKINLDLFKFHKDDLNFNLLFLENLKFLNKIEKFLEKKFVNTNESLFYDGFCTEIYLDKIKQLYEVYEINQEKCFSKKNVQINFLVLKPKAISSLEPEYEFGPIDYTKRKEKVNKAIESKIKKTKKQAIRNLKKESRILDQERQKVLKKIDFKRKEDQKFANQFIEQQNIEHKKLMTSNSKKRFKLRKGKINKK